MQASVRTLAEPPSESVPQASQSDSQSQSIERFWAKERVKPEQRLGSHRGRVEERLESQAVVWVIQDPSDLNFSRSKQTRGLGFIHQTTQQGVKVPTSFAVSGAGAPVGVIRQHTWSRAERRGKRGERHKKATHEKESQRGLDAVSQVETDCNPGRVLGHVGDRAADLFDWFALPRRANSHLLIRAEPNRSVPHELDSLMPPLKQAPVLGEQTIQIEATGERKTAVSRMLKISRNTLDLWLKRKAETGTAQAVTHYQQGNRHKITDWQRFDEFVREQGGKTQGQMAQLWGDNVSQQNISAALRKLGLSRKKRRTATGNEMTLSARSSKND